MDREHLAVALAGTNSIRTWRDRHPGAVLDLSRADFGRADLRSADLSECNLFRADLFDTQCQGACFRGADLRMAYISETDLTGANLCGANLYGANLSMDARVGGTRLIDTDLTGAQLMDAIIKGSTLLRCILDEADLRWTVFVGSDLHDVSCRAARIGGTTFANVDLSNVSGLSTVRHDEPSSLSIDTILKSNGQIPEAFLRGCGYDPALQTLLRGTPRSDSAPGKGATFRLQSCFISYSSKDQPFAD